MLVTYLDVIGAEKSSLNWDSLEHRASAWRTVPALEIPTELLRPNILTDFHTLGYPCSDILIPPL